MHFYQPLGDKQNDFFILCMENIIKCLLSDEAIKEYADPSPLHTCTHKEGKLF